MFNKAEMGKRLELARIEKGISQLELAQQIGLSQGMVGKYERGLNRIPPDSLVKISEILEKPISYFYGETDSAENMQQIFKSFLKDNDFRYSTSTQSLVEVPYLDEIFSNNIIEQISLTRKKYQIQNVFAEEKDTCFAIKTSSLGTVDIDIAVDTLIIVDYNLHPINGDRVLLFYNGNPAVRSYYKRNDVIEFRSSNPLFDSPIIRDSDVKVIGVIIGVEKRI